MPAARAGKLPAEGKGVTARWGLEKAGSKNAACANGGQSQKTRIQSEAVKLGELVNNNEARSIKSRSGKLVKRAGKVSILTRGDLASSRKAILLVKAG